MGLGFSLCHLLISLERFAKNNIMMTKKHTLAGLLAFGTLATAANAAMWIDFNSNQAVGGDPVVGDPADATNAAHNESGYLSYHARHEIAADFTAATYNTSFALTGSAVVTLTPAWPNTTANTVQQSIGRSDEQAASWLGNYVNLLRDWIGTDSRGPGGNLNWDGTTGTPTYFTLTLGGLAAQDYAMRTFHHDVENMNAFFTTEISVDGGVNFGSLLNGRITNSLALGTPAENEILPGTGVNIAGGNPADLSSTQNLAFTANGNDDVVIRFAPLGDDLVHKMFFGINGFQLEQVPEPSTGLLGILGAAAFCLRRRR